MALTRRAGLAVRVQIERADLADAKTIRACDDAHLAAQRADNPGGPWLTGTPFSGWLTVGWDGDPREVWLVRGRVEGAAGASRTGADGGAPGRARSAGGVAGWYRLELPDRENLDRAHLDLVVRPEQRRRGLGLALLRHAVARAAAHGRSVLSAETWNGSPGDAFARSVGAEPGLVNVQRMLELGQLGEDRLVQLRESAGRAAAGYSLVSWTGLVPDKLIEHTAALYAALNDAPHDPGRAPEIWDAQRVRERINGLRPRYGLRVYSVAAMKGDGQAGGGAGEMAALTELAVDPADPGWGHQMITAVTRGHRGHRLGLLVKVALLQLLPVSEPQLERVVTWNAQSNTHMIAVNEALGYTILGPPTTAWRLRVPALLAQSKAAQPELELER